MKNELLYSNLSDRPILPAKLDLDAFREQVCRMPDSILARELRKRQTGMGAAILKSEALARLLTRY